MPTTSLLPSRLLRRAEAAEYVHDKWGYPCSPRTLAKYAVIGGGPVRSGSTLSHDKGNRPMTETKKRTRLFDPKGFQEEIAVLIVFLKHLGEQSPEVLDEVWLHAGRTYDVAIKNIEDGAELDAARDSLPRPWETDERVKAMLDRFENDPSRW